MSEPTSDQEQKQNTESRGEKYSYGKKDNSLFSVSPVAWLKRLPGPDIEPFDMWVNDFVGKGYPFINQL